MYAGTFSEACVRLARLLGTVVSHRNQSGGWYAALRRHERGLWVVAVAALIGDVVSTVAGLASGLTEGNPVVAVSLATWGVGGLLAVKVVALGLAGVCRWLLSDAGPAVALGLATPWAVATLANLAALAAVA